MGLTNSERVKLRRGQSNEGTNDRCFTSLALEPEAATGREGSSGCGAPETSRNQAWLVRVGQIHGQGYEVYENIYSCKTRSVCMREIFTDNAKQQEHEKKSRETR